jgi:hypothetical protein
MMGFDVNDPSIPELNRKPLLRPSGKKVFHDITPTRFVAPLPAASNGPIRARAYRAGKDRNANALDPKGTPHLASEFSPRRD